MIYLISLTECYINKKIYPFVKYELCDVQNSPVPVIVGTTAFYINFYEVLKNSVPEGITKFCFNKDEYIVLNLCQAGEADTISFNEGGTIYSISCNKTLTVSADGKILTSTCISNLKFSHYEAKDGYIYIYFSSERKYVVILKNSTCIYADFYDEVNITAEERLFLTHLNDSLNHGRVCKIDKQSHEIYLVYLDDFPLNLKQEFLPNVFLDCFIAKNLKYCNALLAEEIRQKDEKLIQNFIEDFNCFIPLEQNVFALFNKNRLVNICKFEICENKICNIQFVN